MSCTFECDAQLSQAVNVPVRQVVRNKRMDRKSLSDPPNKRGVGNHLWPKKPTCFAKQETQVSRNSNRYIHGFQAWASDVRTDSHFCLELGVQLTIQFSGADLTHFEPLAHDAHGPASNGRKHLSPNPSFGEIVNKQSWSKIVNA